MEKTHKECPSTCGQKQVLGFRVNSTCGIEGALSRLVDDDFSFEGCQLRDDLPARLPPRQHPSTRGAYLSNSCPCYRAKNTSPASPQQSYFALPNNTCAAKRHRECPIEKIPVFPTPAQVDGSQPKCCCCGGESFYGLDSGLGKGPRAENSRSLTGCEMQPKPLDWPS